MCDHWWSSKAGAIVRQRRLVVSEFFTLVLSSRLMSPLFSLSLFLPLKRFGHISYSHWPYLILVVFTLLFASNILFLSASCWTSLGASCLDTISRLTWIWPSSSVGWSVGSMTSILNLLIWARRIIETMCGRLSFTQLVWFLCMMAALPLSESQSRCHLGLI